MGSSKTGRGFRGRVVGSTSADIVVAREERFDPGGHMAITSISPEWRLDALRSNRIALL